MAFDLGATARRTITLDTGRRKVDAPVDALGRERWRTRMDDQQVELRADGDDAMTASFVGHAAVFDKRTWIGPKRWGFWEQVDSGAFDKTLNDGDVRFLVNHDPNLLLARNTAGTLKLSKDGTGLLAEAPALDRRQTYTNDLVISMERKDINQMSFAFEVLADKWELDDNDDEVRTLLEVKLWDVAVVTYPAYEDTDAGLRGAAFELLCRSAGLNDDQQRQLLHQIAGTVDVPPSGQQPPAEQDPEPGSSTRDDTSQPGSSTGAPLALTRRHALHARKRGLTIPGGTN